MQTFVTTDSSARAFPMMKMLAPGATLMARTDPDTKGAGGVTAFIVEAKTPGITIGKPDRKMGQRGTHTADVIFDNAKVPAANVIGGREGQGFKPAANDRSRRAARP